MGEVADCQHQVTQGRAGQRSGESWCVDCGEHVLTVHDRPCGECRHLFSSVGYTGCRKHLMAVSRSMRVTYYVNAVTERGQHGLCFEAKVDQNDG